MRTDYTIQQGALVIRVLLDDPSTTLRLIWRGQSVERNPSTFLLPFFTQWANEAEECGFTLSMDFSRLEFMNSSSISPIIAMVQDLKQRRVPLILRYDGKIKWQSLSFAALRVFVGGPGKVTLDDSGEEVLPP